MPRPNPIVVFISRDTTDHTIILAIRGVAYEYFLTPQQCDTTEYLCRKGLARRALNFAKSRASRVLKVRRT